MASKLEPIKKITDIDKLVFGHNVYLLLKNDDQTVQYVSRANSNLTKIIQKQGYNYFRIKMCENESEAYYWECRYYHMYIETIEIKTHPIEPASHSDGCPHCDYMSGQ